MVTREAKYEGEIDPHTPLFINITYTKKRPSFRQNSWCAKGRMLPWLGVLIRPTVGDLFLLLSILSCKKIVNFVLHLRNLPT